MENPIEMGWFGGTPIFGNTHIPKTYQSSNMDLQDVAMNYTPELTNMTLLENPPFSLKKILKWWCLSISHVSFFFGGVTYPTLGKQENHLSPRDDIRLVHFETFQIHPA